jgi:outer membrane protein TolC
MRHRPTFALFVIALWGSQAILASAQEPQVIEFATKAELAAPIAPEKSAGPLSLDECIELGFQYQPALEAARASFAAAHSGKQGVDRMVLAGLFAKDLKIRRQQACQGVNIAGAAVTQAEWETRYAVTRNFFTVQYVRSQRIVVDDVLRSLTEGRKKAYSLWKEGNADIKINKLDIEGLDIQIGLVQAKKHAVDNGLKKAEAALREAMGVRYDFPLDVADAPLPAAVYEVKKYVDEVVEEKDKQGKMEKKIVKREVIEYFPVYKFNQDELVASALANRGEITQANAANRVVQLEIDAQRSIFGLQGRTFAMGSDPHVQPVPQGHRNGEYAPGAFSIEMAPMLGGRKKDRVQRATDLAQRAAAVVDKAENLVSLEVVAQYLKWQEAVDDIQSLRRIEKLAAEFPKRVQTLNAKEFTSSAVIQANMAAIQVRSQLNEEMHNHALALAGLERATAGAFRVYPVPAPK